MNSRKALMKGLALRTKLRMSTVNCQPRVKHFYYHVYLPLSFYIFSSVYRFTWFTNTKKATGYQAFCCQPPCQPNVNRVVNSESLTGQSNGRSSSAVIELSTGRARPFTPYCNVLLSILLLSVTDVEISSEGTGSLTRSQPFCEPYLA